MKKSMCSVLIIVVKYVLMAALIVMPSCQYTPVSAKTVIPSGEFGLLREAFAESGATFLRAEAQGWTKIAKACAEGPGAQDQLVFKYQDAIDKITARVTLATAEGAILAICLETESASEVSKMDALILSMTGIREFQVSRVITGTIEGRLSPPQVNELVGKMLAAAQAQKVETLEEGQLVSVSAYAPRVRHRLTIEGKSVNINIGLRYNSLENRTYLYLGSPIITSEY